MHLPEVLRLIALRVRAAAAGGLKNMWMRRALIAGVAAGLCAGVAAAQEAADLIADLMQRQAARPEPQPYAAPALTAPVMVDEIGKSPEGPLSVSDLAYDSRLKASSASAQRFQGPLDGGWILAEGVQDLYALQLADRGRGEVEGAWRDLSRRGALDGSGFVDQIEVVGDEVTLRFDAGRRVARLEASGGRWSGELEHGGQTRRVTLRRAP